MNRRILVTGSAGFLGEATLDRLTGSDPSNFLVCVDTRQTLGPTGDTRKFVSVTRDIREPLDDLLVDYSIDTVIHLAFMLQSQQDPAEAHRTNVEATESLLVSCARAGIRQIVYLSSATVYGAHPDNERPFTEDDPVNPAPGFTYSEHKVEAERIILAHAETNLECVVSVLRGCVVMGPAARNFITESLGLRFLPVHARNDPEMQFLHVDDYSSAVEAVLMHRSRGIFNIAGSGTVSWRELVRLAGSKAIPAPAMVLKGIVNLSWKLKLQQRSPAAGLAFIRYPWLVSTERMATELGWSPQHSSQSAVRSWADSRK